MSYHLTENFEGAVIRIAGTPDAPMFNATDVCGVMGLAYVSQALESLDDDEKGEYKVPTLGGTQTVWHVTESGLYHLAFKSRKAAAKRFRRWVTMEVLPEIRRTGAFHGSEPISRDTQRLPLTRWVGTLGLDLRDDARTVMGILPYVTRAANMLRWHVSMAKGQNADSLFQEVPLPVLDLAEGMWMADTKSYRATQQGGLSVITRPTDSSTTGWTIKRIIEERQAKEAEAHAYKMGETIMHGEVLP